jgi:ParB family chromosome partitioning protein
LSVRGTEKLVKHMLQPKTDKPSASSATSGNADIRRLEIEVSDKIGAKVRVEHTRKGSGKLLIPYNNLDELDGILKHIK